MVWRGRFAEVYQNAGIISRAERMYYLMNSVYANALNGNPDWYLGYGYAAGSTAIQKQLGVGFPQNSIFRYEVCPNTTCAALTRVYVYEPGYSWCTYYDYVAGIWNVNATATGPGCKYFVKPQG